MEYVKTNKNASQDKNKSADLPTPREVMGNNYHRIEQYSF